MARSEAFFRSAKASLAWAPLGALTGWIRVVEPHAADAIDGDEASNYNIGTLMTESLAGRNLRGSLDT